MRGDVRTIQQLILSETTLKHSQHYFYIFLASKEFVDKKPFFSYSLFISVRKSAYMLFLVKLLGDFDSAGQNMYFGLGSTKNDTVAFEEAITMWYDEVEVFIQQGMTPDNWQ